MRPSQPAQKRPAKPSSTRQRSSKAAARTLQAIVFIVPAALGFMVAYAILSAMSPYGSVPEWFMWLAIGLIISFATSLFTADAFRSFIRRTPLYQLANNFDTEVEALFGPALREGSPKNVRRNAVKLGHNAEFIDEVLLLLDQMARHERLSRGHNERVRAYASLIGKEIGLSQSELELLNWTALLHDIGKLDVPPWILSSPTLPNDEEWEILKRHPESAKHRLRRLEKTLGEGIYDGPLYHHERWDGQGYPYGLSEGEIPLFGRITAIADAFDVMTNARSYKKPMPISDAREDLMSGAGKHFDPDLVTAFVRLGDQELKDVRGWSATFAGVALTGSRLALAGSQAVAVAATVAGAGVASVSADTLPPALAFDDPPPATTLPLPTTTQAPTTSTTTTVAPTTTIITTTTIAERLMSLNYEIGNNEIDGVQVTVEADELQVFLDGELYEIFVLEEGQRRVPVVLNVTDLASGVHEVQFDLYLNGELLSTDQSVIVV